MAEHKKSAGVPITLLHEGEGHVVTVELKNGETYRGILSEAEDTMNCQMTQVTMTGRDGRVTKLEQCFLRGGMIKFIVLPDMLKQSPLFKTVEDLKAKLPPLAARGGAAGAGAKRPRTGK
jgi:small nuclear ribonucleoprotein D3